LYLLIINLTKIFKRKISEYDFYALEKELEELSSSSELLRKRFVSTIELLNDGICFRDFDDTMFGSDKYIEITGLKDNQFMFEDFEKILYKDDLPEYKNMLEKTTKKSPIYNVSYRVNTLEDIKWIKETGKRIIIDKKITYISIIKPMDIKQFPDSEIDVLNGLSNEKKMYIEMQKLTKTKTPYYFIKIRQTNIPKINEKYGRDVGDLMMGEYIKKLRYNFIKDNESLYRIGGIDFGLIIKDEKKYEFLKRALTGGGELLNLKMVFGGITQTLYPNLGIAESPYDAKSPDQVIEEANEALRLSLLDQTHKNYCFFEKI
jgi:GGDEF domain-containing protein